MLSTSWSLVFEKIILGMMLAVPIGPVSVAMIKKGLEKGFYAAFSVRLGGAIGNILCLFMVYWGLLPLMRQFIVMSVLGLVGSLLLLWMGINTFVKNTNIACSLSSATKYDNGLIQGFYLSVINPVAFVFWSGVFVVHFKIDESFLFNLFIIVGVLIWGAILSATVSLSKSILNKSIISILTKGAGLLMIFYSFKYAYNAFQDFNNSLPIGHSALRSAQLVS